MERRPVFVIAEAGVNHNGSLETGLALVERAAQAGADAVKFQSFRTADLVASGAPKAAYQKVRTPSSETQREMLEQLELTEAMHVTLAKRCRNLNIEFMSSPFDVRSAHMLSEKVKVRRIKIPSGEIDNAPLLLEISALGRPVILSTGMSTLADVETALGVLAFGILGWRNRPSRSAFQDAYAAAVAAGLLREKVTILHCTTQYPASFDEVNLQAMETLRKAFGLPVGLSDHTEGIAVPIAAVAFGAVVIEKHLTLDCNLPGPDHAASLEPSEFAKMVSGIRQVERALGSRTKIPTPSEMNTRSTARRSLVAARAIRRGEKFSPDNVAIKRPGTGIRPIEYWDLIGRSSDRNYDEDELIRP